MEEKKQVATSFLAARYRRPTKAWRVTSIVSPVIAIALAITKIFHIIVLGFVIVDVAYLYLLIALFLPLLFIWVPAGRGTDKDKVPWYDILLILISFAAPFFLFLQTAKAILGWEVAAPPEATIAGAIMWVLLIEVARRTLGLFFMGFVLVFSTYPLYAFIMPTLLRTGQFSLERVINYHVFSDVSIVGIPMNVFGGLLFGFMFFALCVQSAGAGKLFTDVSLALLRETRGGAAKVSVVASGLFGTISGSPVANVLVDGGITIPAMKKAGFPGHFAGAVEACASTGGALMPPVMGTAAFLMADFLGVSYAKVCIAAILPSLLYYFTLFIQVDAYAARAGLKPQALLVTIPKLQQILFDHVHILIGVLVLVYLLFFMEWVNWSPWIASGVIFAVAMLRKKTRLHLRDYLDFIQSVGRTLAELVSILSAVGLVIGALILTGIAHAIPFSVIELAHGNIYILIFFAAIAAFILGMGLPVVACYIFLAMVLGPSLVSAGLNPMAAHLFLMYCAILSFITPPVALAAFAAAIIAGADPMKTGFQACRLGIATFILPFFFVLNPSLILQGPLLGSLWSFSTAALGLALISGSFEGYLWWIGRLGMMARVLLFGAGLSLAFPAAYADFIGTGIAAVVIIGYLISNAVRKKTARLTNER